jgi:hypothetical protein
MRVAFSQEKQTQLVCHSSVAQLLRQIARRLTPSGCAEYATKRIRNVDVFPVHIYLHCVIRKNVSIKFVAIIVSCEFMFTYLHPQYYYIFSISTL